MQQPPSPPRYLFASEGPDRPELRIDLGWHLFQGFTHELEVPLVPLVWPEPILELKQKVSVNSETPDDVDTTFNVKVAKSLKVIHDITDRSVVWEVGIYVIHQECHCVQSGSQ